MKMCERCGEEIDGGDGENFCRSCEDSEGKKLPKRKALLKKEREQIMRDLGLVKVRGALGGTYWE